MNLAVRVTDNPMLIKLVREFSGGLDMEIKDSLSLRIIDVNVWMSLNKKWISQNSENQFRLVCQSSR